MTDDDLIAEVDRLEPSNRKHAYGIAEQMAKQLNLTKSERIGIDMLSTYRTLWEAEGVKSITTPKVREIKRNILNYFHEIEVVKAITDEGISAILQVNRAKFDLFYKDLKARELRRVIDETSRILAAKAKTIPNAPKAVATTPLYEITFKDGVIALNNLYLTKPQFDSINYDFFEFVFKRPNQRHNVSELMASLNQKQEKTIHQILNDLGFTDSLKAFFFPNASTNFVEFNNPITSEQVEERGLGLLKVEISRKSSKSSRSSQNK